MDTVLLRRIICENTGKVDRIKGELCYKKALVRSIEDKIVDKEELQIHGKVKSEKRNDAYETEAVINLKHKCAIEASCECFDFYTNYFNHDIYFCKHITATLYKYIELLENGYKKEKTSQVILNSYKNNVNLVKEKIKIEVILSGNIEAIFTPYNIEFKIGINKLYVLKDIREFLKCLRTREKLRYGNEFTFDINKQEFESEDESLIEFMENMNTMDETYSYTYGGNKVINMKTITLPRNMLRAFLEGVKEKEIKLDFGTIFSNAKVLCKRIPLDFIIKKNDEDDVILSQISKYPIPLNEKKDVFLGDGNIYIPPKEQLIQYKPLYENLGGKRQVKFTKEEREEALATLIPILGNISSDVKIHKDISVNIIKEQLKVKFYLDKEKRDVILSLKLIYGDNESDYINYDTGNKIILRNYDDEQKVLNKLESLKFVVNNNKFVYKGKDNDFFYFLQEGIRELSELGEVYYSDRFKESKIHSKGSINANISDSSDGYLDFSFNIGDISYDEMNEIIAAFRNNRKFYRLKNDSFIDFREKEMQDFFKLLENLSDEKIYDNVIKIHKNKALYLSSAIADKEIKFVDGQDILDGISHKIKNIGELSLAVPQELNADLRSYQTVGYKWLKTLAYYEFGGILADEMGLGKTVQTIAFILSENERKSLIVAPTSLVYNWQSEFEKFAPTMKILIIHGNKEEREVLLKNIKDYDVIITTYNLLRIDFELYKDINFDYFIIDEAQNIKNPLAQITEAVKGIKSKVRFALTGTPIENSLIELWSIFDFVMPGYLFNRHLFQQRFMKGMNNKETFDDLNRLIKPFILRRCKKEVIKELPEKIEKKLLVDMTEEQKKVYATFATKIKKDIEGHIVEGEFNKKQIEILAYITKLRQICLDPSILVKSYNSGSGKIDALMETLSQSIEEGHKILVFSQFTSVLKNIAKVLKENNIEHYYLDGSTKASKRLEMVSEFNSGDKPVFLISLKAGGTGLNLTSADVVIHFDPWWNPAVEDQATDRAHRIGQNNIVEVIKLIAKGTIEEKILKLQDKKKEIINSVMTGELNNGNILRNLSEDDILELFNS